MLTVTSAKRVFFAYFTHLSGATKQDIELNGLIQCQNLCLTVICKGGREEGRVTANIMKKVISYSPYLCMSRQEHPAPGIAFYLLLFLSENTVICVTQDPIIFIYLKIHKLYYLM